jgi:hypothetical protein
MPEISPKIIISDYGTVYFCSTRIKTMQYHFLIGGLFGFFSAIIAGIIDSQLFSKRRLIPDDPISDDSSLGSPMLILAGIINSVVGVISMIISLLVTGSLLNAFFLGAAVLVGFVLGFLLLASVLIIRDK